MCKVMKVLELKELNEEQVKEIRKLEGICKQHDGLKGDVFLSSDLSFNKEVNCFFLGYKDDVLVSFLSMFIPTSEEAEISAYTLPLERNKGYFKLLLKKSMEEIKKYGVNEMLFVQEPESKAAKCVLKNLNAKYDFSEYLLIYGSNKGLKSRGILNLVPVQRENADEIAEVYVDIYNNTLEMAQSMVNRALDSEDREPYMVKSNDEIVGVGSISLENNDGLICGLGILQKYRGLGYGKELLNLLIEKMLDMDIKDILLEVDSKNHIAYNLYINNGFEIKTQFDYYRYEL